MGTNLIGSSSSTFNGMRQELMSLRSARQQDRSSHYIAKDHDDFISSESDRQMLLVRWIMCIYYYYYLYMNDFYCMLLIGEFRQQDEELDELSESVQRIGSVGLTIHDELHAQEKLLEELGSEMDSTSNRLDFVQVSLISCPIQTPVSTRHDITGCTVSVYKNYTDSMHDMT